MKKLDYYTNLKMGLVSLSMNINDNTVGIYALQLYCPWLLNDDNLKESYSRLADIHNQNFYNMQSLIDYMEYIDESHDSFSLYDLKDEYEYIRDNMMLQKEYFDNMVSYIDFCNDYSNPWVDVAKFCVDYCDKDDQIFDQVQVNDSIIKCIRKEREDNFEQN